MKRIDNKISCLIIIFTIQLMLLSCTSISQKYPDGDFRVLIVSDTHISNDQSKIDRLNSLIEKTNVGEFPGVAFVVNTGDVVSSVYKKYETSDQGGTNFRLQTAVRSFNKFDIPYYFVMGNHDYKIDSDRDSDAPFEEEEILMMENIWKETTGFNPYYSFEFNGWKFIILNSMRGRYLERHFDDIQLDWLTMELNSNLPSIIFFHHPLETDHFRLWGDFDEMITPENEIRFYSMIKKYKENIKGIFVGHGHFWVSDVLYDSIQVYETDSFGDETELIYLVLGLDNTTQSISVGKMPDLISMVHN